MLLQYDDTEKRREMAKNSLERYTHYYERWATNQSVGAVFKIILFQWHYFLELSVVHIF